MRNTLITTARILCLTLSAAACAFSQCQTVLNPFTGRLDCGGSVGGGQLSVSSAAYTAGTYYFAPGGGLPAAATFAAVAGRVGVAGTLSNFTARLPDATGTGTATFTWMRDPAGSGSPAAQTITCAAVVATSTSCADTTHSVSESVGDFHAIRMVVSGATITSTLVMAWGLPGVAGPAGPAGTTISGCASDGLNGLTCTGDVTAARHISPAGTVFSATGACVAAASVPTPATGDSTTFYDLSNSCKLSRKNDAGTVSVVEGGSATFPAGIGILRVDTGTPSVQTSIFSGGTKLQRAVECTYGTVSYTALTSAATSQEITLLTTQSGNTRYEQITLSESTQFAGVTGGIQVSLGRPGVSTHAEMTGGTFLLGVSSSDSSFYNDRPTPPQLTSTYSVVLNFSAVNGSALVNTSTAGVITWEACGYAAR